MHLSPTFLLELDPGVNLLGHTAVLFNCVWRSGDNLEESVLSSHHPGFQDEIQVVRLEQQAPFLPEPSHQPQFKRLRTHQAETAACTFPSSVRENSGFSTPSAKADVFSRNYGFLFGFGGRIYVGPGWPQTGTPPALAS